MFMPHQPEPIRAVRYFLPVWALSMAGAEKAKPDAIELLRNVRRLIDMIISPLVLKKLFFYIDMGSILRLKRAADFLSNLTICCYKSSEKASLK
jgi:hypothetical protein